MAPSFNLFNSSADAMAPPVPSPVSKWHIHTYPAVDPKRPELSAAGKTVVITGAGAGIGREVVHSFAAAGATNIHILGRTRKTLEESKALTLKDYPTAKVTVHIADVADESEVHAAAKAIGAWDILISNAGYLPKRNPLDKTDGKDWWLGFETNVRGNFIVSQAFLPSRNPGASLVGVSTGAVSFPIGTLSGGSSYVVSKLAVIKFFEFIAAEHPDLQVVSIHPGVIQTAMATKSELDVETFDDLDLAGNFMVWAASKEAAFANGRMIWVNWDVEELAGLKDKLEQDPTLLTAGMLGWPFPRAA